MSLASTAWRHMRTLWPRWTLLPAAPFLTWSTIQTLRGSLRWEHVAMPIAALLLAYSTPKTRKLLIGIYPVALVGVLYDIMAVLKKTFGLVPHHVHICDLHDAEVRWFSFARGAERVSLPELLQSYTRPWLDVVCSVPYAMFIYAVLIFGAYLYFRSYDTLRTLGWAFLLTNLAGFITYHAYPAAPPWYFQAHGCVVDFSVPPSAGPGLARVDLMIGAPFFGSMYARAATPFGAVPSLHVAYPMLMVASGWKVHRAPGRALLVCWYLWMCFSAAYLDHHWIIDMFIGSVYALTAVLGVLAVRSFLASRQAPAEAFYDGAASGPKPQAPAEAFYDGAASGPKPRTPVESSR